MCETGTGEQVAQLNHSVMDDDDDDDNGGGGDNDDQDVYGGKRKMYLGFP